MPRVEQAQQRVQTQVTQGARAGAPVPSGAQQLARGLQQAAGALQDFQQRADTAAAEQAAVSFEKAKNDLFFNPDSGYFNTQGKNAYDTAPTARQSLEDLKQQYAQGLDTDAARTMFNRVADRQILAGDRDIARHSAKGLQAWEISTANAQIENTVENAALYWSDSERLGVQRELGRQQILDVAKMEGVTGVALNERLQTYESSFASAAVTAAIAQSSKDGDEALAQHSKALEGPDKLKLDKALTARKAAERTQQLANESVAKATTIVDQFDTRASVTAEVNKIEDPELRGKTMREAMYQFNRRKEADSEARAASFESAEEHLREGGSAESFQAIDPEGWDRLSPEQKRKVESGKLVSTDWAKFSDLMTMSDTELAKVDPTKYFSVLAEPQRRSLISAVKAAKGQGSSSDKTDHQFGRTRNQETTSAAIQLFGEKSKWKGDKLTQVNTFYALLDAEASSREATKGAKLTSQEYTALLADLTRKTVEEGFIFDTERTLEDVPPEFVPQISNYLRDNGVPVTSDNIIRAYQQATE